MLNSKEIIEAIKLNKKYNWKLYSVVGMSRNLIGSFDKETETINGDEEGSSLNKLEVSLGLFQNIPNAIFEIEVKPSKTSNGDTILNLPRFTISGVEQQNQNNQGLGSVSQNYLTLGQVDAMIQNATEKVTINFEKQMLAQEKQRFAQEVKDKQEELDKKDAKSKIKEMEIKYNTKVIKGPYLDTK